MNITPDQIKGQIASKEAEIAALVAENETEAKALQEATALFQQRRAERQAKVNMAQGAIETLRAFSPKAKTARKAARA